jgi:hypothetical protein
VHELSPIEIRHGLRSRRLPALFAAVVLAFAGLVSVADVARPDGIQGTGHISADAHADGIEGSG